MNRHARRPGNAVLAPRSHRVVDGASAGLDGIQDVAIASLGLWTVLYAGTLLGLPLPAATGAWLILTLALAALRTRAPWLGPVRPVGPGSTVVAGAWTLGAGLLASVVVRAEWDDAFYLTRSTWVADHGTPATRDFLFTDGEWPATVGAVPNLSSIETLFGAIARYTGAEVGDVVYLGFVPVATAAAVWSLWFLLRASSARRPAAALSLAMVVLLWGGYAHASWGNLHLARIWQGKVVLVAVLIPYLYGAIVSLLPERERDRGLSPPSLLALLAGGAAAVGASSTSVFVVPLIAVGAGLGLAWAGRPRWGLLAGASLAAAPVAAGVVTILSPVGSRDEPGLASGLPWQVVLADGRLVLLMLVAVAVLVIGAVRPGAFTSALVPGRQRVLAAAAMCAVLVAVPPGYTVLTTLLGGDAVAYRVGWVLPLPAVVGLLASLPSRRFALPVAPLAGGALAVVLAVGTPIWAPSNGAFLAAPGTWKVRAPEDLVAARWIVEEAHGGRYLAANWVTFLVGTVSSAPRPVGTRLDYVETLAGVPGSLVEERTLLQQIADGADARTPENRELAISALAALEVGVACVAWRDGFVEDVLGSAGFVPALDVGPWTCWRRS